MKLTRRMLINAFLWMFCLHQITHCHDVTAPKDYSKATCDSGSCHAGRDGRDGHPGHPGRDGRDGCPGPVGPQGKDGKDGLPGKDGVNGTNGKPGMNGIDGMPGKDGKDGKDGNPAWNGIPGKDGKDGLSGRRNIKHCSWKHHGSRYIDKKQGFIKICAFTSQRYSPSSLLMVTVTTNARIYRCRACCKRWYVSFDGLQCSTPIEQSLYSGHHANEMFFPITLSGLCQVDTSKSRTISVSLDVDDCPHAKGGVDAHTGYATTTRIIVEEVLIEKAKNIAG